MHPDTDDRIQSAPNALAQRGEFELPQPARYRTRLGGMLLGACAGPALGMLTVAVGYWFSDFGDHVWEGASYGALAGLAAGPLIGFVERTLRSDLTQPDVSTAIGGLFGLVLGPLMVLGINSGGGGFSFMVLIGALFAGPMLGLLFGALFDRAYDSWSRREWATAVGFAVFGMAACVGIVLLIAATDDPDPQEVAKDTRRLVAQIWQHDPKMKEAKINKITLDYQGNRRFTGMLEASHDGQAFQLDIDVTVRHGTIQAQWKPRD